MSRARQVKLQQAASNRRQHLLRTHSAASGSARLSEVVGVTTVECAVVCCCCPCGLISLLVLAFKVPAGLCRRALRNKRRRRMIGKGILPQRLRRCKCRCDEVEIPIYPIGREDALSDIEWQKSEELDKEAMELEKEMWDMFSSTGFWRSPSARECPRNPIPSINSADSLFQLTSARPDCR